MRPVLPLRLSWRIIQTKAATKGSTNINQKIIEAKGMGVITELLGY